MSRRLAVLKWNWGKSPAVQVALCAVPVMLGSSAPPGINGQDVQALNFLQDYTKRDLKGLAQPMRDSKLRRDQLRHALQFVFAHKHEEVGWDPEQPQILLGILCSDARLGVRALRDWCCAAGTKFVMPESQVRSVCDRSWPIKVGAYKTDVAYRAYLYQECLGQFTSNIIPCQR